MSMNEQCSDNRFEIIEKAKKDLLDSTNINTSEKEMEVLDRFLFRCWQMDWLKEYDNSTKEKVKIYNSLSIDDLQEINYAKFDFTFADAQKMENRFVKEYEGNKDFDLYYNSLRQIISHAYQRAVDDMHKFFTGKEVELPF